MAHLAASVFVPLQVAILTVSDTRVLETDDSGRTLSECVQSAGHRLIDRQLVPDDIYRLRAQVSQWIADPAVQVILITGGTGFTDRDNTPQAIGPLLDKVMDGFGELFRQLSYQEIGTSTIQSRALAGFANGSLVCCLPGSPGACRTAWDGILHRQLNSTTRPCNAVAHLYPANSQVSTSCCGSRS
ncbi:molybdenum cofactor biosynthesis protein B [Halopseudomonas salegens]|uniref:Molybdenum cofactor biosynthesis protein B n=1 Tax=Halopseudomonas salegens TaxID=1434072 RepID=A0A1H2F8T0_9GAMM|nr:molybdenum cofactor biosynthesis protein B [Halopseudomonas salegens]SDU03388.1 molybdenum cofactor biosynthesis protein B [Halopseudomonas salegens]